MFGESAPAQRVIQLYKDLSGTRGNWESHWQEIAERVYPAYSNTFHHNYSSPGEKKTEHIFDSTASVALKRFAAILDSLLTPRNSTWHRVLASEPELNQIRNIRLWFEELNRLLFKYRYAPKANFSSQNQQNYLSLGAFGTGCVFTDSLRLEAGLRYRSISLGEIYFSDNHQGITDTAIRRFPLKIRQAYQKWGELLPESLKGKKDTKGDEDCYFLHCVRPRKNYDPERIDGKGLPIESLYVVEEGEVLLEEGGYTTFPYAISRYEQAPGEVYGRSPAMDALPAIKTLNEEKKTLLKQGHRAVDPVLLTHDDGILSSFSLKPGAINAGGVSADGRPLVHALQTGNLAVGKDLMDDERMIINDVFLVTLFQILVETPTMTATEVMERTREKGILLAPTVGRQQSEYLGPLIEREVDLLIGQGLVPPPPPELIEARGDYRVEYDSPLSRAQRAEEVAGVMRSFEQTLGIVNVTQDPSPLDWYDLDVIVPEISEIQAVPARWMNSVEKVQQIREMRQQQIQQQQVIEALPGAASMVKAGAAAEAVGAKVR